MAVEIPAPVRTTRSWALPGRLAQCRPSLLAALALACLYAAFAEGATRPPQDTRLQVALALLVLLALGSWARGGSVRWRAGRAATAGLGLLAALAAWEGLTLLWSVTPDATWIEVNRAIAYVLVVALALAAGATEPRAAERAGLLLLASCTAVAAYAFATAVLPGVRVPGLFDLDQTGVGSRLREPLGYWNALALVCAIAVPLALRLACDRGRRERERALAVAAALLLVCVIALSYSRGGVIALLAGVAVLVTLGPGRLRTLVVLAGVGVASAPVLAVAFSLDGTSGSGVPLARRSHDGGILLLVFVVALELLLAAAVTFWRREDRIRWSAARTRLVFRGLATLVALAIVGGAAVLAASDRGLPGAVSDRVSTFTDTREDAQSEPGRLVTTTSGNRWVWWREAVGAWSDRPVAGWGAGSFRALHLRYRRDRIPVTQAHSVPLQLLAETGVVGLVLALGAFGALLAAALARVRGLPEGRERAFAAAGLAGVAAWLVHGLYDWDWGIPGASLPALVLLGVLAGASGRERTARTGGGATAAAVVPAAVLLSVVVLSAVLPAWADSKATGAQTAVAATATDAQLRRAAAQADLAARLDPLALRPLLASAAIARRRGRLLEARAALLRAVDRQPESSEAWLNLAASAFELADRVGFERAALRALELDPMGARTRTVALAAVANRTPPGASATAVGTPLTPAPVQGVAPPTLPPASG